MSKKFWLLCIFAIASPIAGLFFGAADFSPGELLYCLVDNCSNDVNHMIFWDIRAPRVFVGFLVGAGLAVAGATLQNIDRLELLGPGKSTGFHLYSGKTAQRDGPVK